MDDSSREMTLVDHLNELRRRIIVCLVSVTFGSIISFYLTPAIIRLFKKLAGGAIEKLAFFSPTEAIVSYFKIAIIGGIILAMPIILYQLWAFILPAIGPLYRRKVLGFAAATFIFFILGAAFAYFVLIPCSLKFLLKVGSDELTPVISVDKYVSFIGMLLLAAGAVFQMPVIAWLLARLQIISSSFLKKSRKFAILAILIVAAIVTPTPDAVNMLMLAAPMFFLYEISVWVVRCAEILKLKRIS